VDVDDLKERKKAEDQKTRANRKTEGWIEVKTIVPPPLALVMDQQRGDLPRSQWLIQRALEALRLDAEPIALQRRGGRPRRVAPESLVVPADGQSYTRSSWWNLTRRYREKPLLGCIGRRDLSDGTTNLAWEFKAQFGSFDPYQAVSSMRSNKRHWHGRWWSVSTLDADKICGEAVKAGAKIVDLDKPGGESWAGMVIEVRPMVNRLTEVPRWWSLEVDFAAIREILDHPTLAAFANSNWQATIGAWGWARNNAERLVSEAITSETLAIIRERLADHDVQVIEGQPIGLSQDPFTAERDELGLLVTVTGPANDRRAFDLLDDQGRQEVSIKQWPTYRDRVGEAGFEIVETGWQDRQPVAVDWSQVPGGDQPVNGRRLRDYQRAGVEFILGHAGRCLVADEMGTGKTAQVIAAFGAMAAQRRLVICPKAAVNVWIREIQAWNHDAQRIVVVNGSTEVPDLPDSGWVILTFDILTPRAEKIPLTGYSPEQLAEVRVAFIAGGAEKSLSVQWADPKLRTDIAALTVKLDPEDGVTLEAVGRLDIPVSGFTHSQRLKDATARVTGVLRQALLDWNSDALAVDEAHRIKNPKAARTKTVRLLVQDPGRAAVLLTGTPIRNRAEEGLDLLEAVVPVREYRSMLATGRVSHAELTKALLEKYMIRRTKTEVNPELPKKIRQRFDVEPGPKARFYVDEYLMTMDMAQDKYFRELMTSGSRQQASKAAMPLWSKARKLVGMAKVVDGIVAELVQEVVEERGSCIVFAHHLDVIETLRQQLEQMDMTVGVIIGGTSTEDRGEIERAFQAGELDVFLGGIMAASESINLSYADTCLFAELSWTPADLFQAEARGHRQGQTANGYHILTALTDLDMDQMMWWVLGRKAVEIGETLGEEIRLDFDWDLAEQAEAASIQRLLEAKAWQQAQANGISEEDLSEFRSPGSGKRPSGKPSLTTYDRSDNGQGRVGSSRPPGRPG